MSADGVHFVALGEPETGLWCEKCLKHSKARQQMAVEVGDTPILLGHVVACVECGDVTGEVPRYRSKRPR